MKIYYDPTEARSHTRLPQKVIRIGVNLKGLEKYTGSDLLISPLDTPPLVEVNECLATQAALRIHCSAGVLIQRKSGRDFTSSIAKLPEIEHRMLEWTPNPWLLIIAKLGCDSHEKATINGRAATYSFWSVVGALDSWQSRGGCWTLLSQDSQIDKWLASLSKRIQESGTVVVEPHKKQELVRLDKNTEEMVNVLTGFPGIGVKTALSVLKDYGNLKDSLVALSKKGIHKCKDRPDGVGLKLTSEYRRVLGLEECEELEVVCDD